VGVSPELSGPSQFWRAVVVAEHRKTPRKCCLFYRQTIG
jgi:hypothetical protein